ncbi:MAG: hypothetical protein V4480_00755 [Patescibacteria group bacterium]
MAYTEIELAELARKDELPGFISGNWPGSKDILLRYPRSMRDYGDKPIYAGGLLIFPISIVILVLANSAAPALAIALLGIVLMWAGARGKRTLTKRRMILKEVGEALTDIVELSGSVPAQLKNFNLERLVMMVDHLIVDACKAADNATFDPAWTALQCYDARQVLREEPYRRFKMFEPLGLTSAGKMHYYWNKSKSA